MNDVKGSDRSFEMVGKSFFDTSDILNVNHIMTLALWKYFANNYFKGDMQRLVYSSNDYAFRRRHETNPGDVQGLNFPFMNIKLRNISNNNDRNWKNRSLEASGVYQQALGAKIYLTPVRLEFDATMFLHKEADLHAASNKFLWDNAVETFIQAEVEAELNSRKAVFKLQAYLDYEMEYDNQYNEKEWLEKNKIRTIAIQPSLNTFLVNTQIGSHTKPRFAMTKKFILSLYENSNINFVDHLLEDLEWSSQVM